MRTYKPDPFLFRLGRAVERATAQFANARQGWSGVDAARANMDRAIREFSAYQGAAAKLSERERQYAIARNIPAPELLQRRATLPPDTYAAALAAGTPLPPAKPAPTRLATRVVRGVDVGLTTRIVR